MASLNQNQQRSSIVAHCQRIIGLSLSYWFGGRDSQPTMQCGRTFMLSGRPTHTLWARCFERMGYCYGRLCEIPKLEEEEVKEKDER
jgi:hypothetical protein